MPNTRVRTEPNISGSQKIPFAVEKLLARRISWYLFISASK